MGCKFTVMFMTLVVGILLIGEGKCQLPQLPIDTCLSQILSLSYTDNPDTGLKTDELLMRHGYPVQRLSVTTADGYILTVFRVPYGKNSPLVEGQTKKPVYLNHGLLSSSFQWVLQANGRNLAMMLADAGYDVFLGNCRGSSYSQGHVNKTTNDVSYWDFSWHEMGVYDVPAVVDKILALTGSTKTFYVGHSMGTTQYLVSLSEIPSMNDKIFEAYLYAPAAYMSHSTSGIRYLSPLAYNLQYLTNPLLGGKLPNSQQFQQYTGIPLGTLCEPSALACGVCGNLVFLMFGFDAPQTNYTQLSVALGAFPDTASTKSAVHYAQLMNDASFRQFNYLTASENLARYGTTIPPSYDLSAITAPTVIYYGDNDNLNPPIDAKRTASELRPSTLKQLIEVPWPLYNHMDFAIAINATEWNYQPTIQRMNLF